MEKRKPPRREVCFVASTTHEPFRKVCSFTVRALPGGTSPVSEILSPGATVPSESRSVPATWAARGLVAWVGAVSASVVVIRSATRVTLQACRDLPMTIRLLSWVSALKHSPYGVGADSGHRHGRRPETGGGGRWTAAPSARDTDRHSNQKEPMDTLFIAGAWRPAHDAQTRTIHCPADGREVVTVAEASEADARDAVAAARAAFDDGPWPRTPAPERAALLRRLADRLEAERDEVARLESLDTGKRFVESQIDVDDIVAVFRHFADLATADAGRVVDTGMPDVSSRVVHEPVGRLLADHAVELPAAADRVEGRAVPGGRQHLRPQAQRAHAEHRDVADAGARRRRPPRRGRQPRARRRARPRVRPWSRTRRVDLVSFTGGAGDRPRDHGGRPRPR